MRARLTVLGIAALLACGCAPIDRWGIFDLDWESRVGPDDEAADAEEYGKYAPRHETPPGLPELDGEGVLELSVEQAALLALRNNHDLAVQQLNPVIAGTFEEIERGVYDPELFAEGDFRDQEGSEVARSTRQQFGVKVRDTDAVVGVRQVLPTGTTIEGTVGHERTDSDRAPEQQEARLGLTVTQSLLQGFGPAVNLARVRQAELDTVASACELRGFAESLLARAEIGYWNFALAREEIAIFERSLEVARQQAREIESRIKVGTLAETEAAAARAEVARREQALIEARSKLEERRLRLLRAINPDPDGSLDRQLRATSSLLIAPEPIKDEEDRLKLADKMRPDLNEARARLEQDRLETIVTRNGLLPKLDLFAAVGKTGYAQAFEKSFRELDGDTYDFTAGIELSYYLGNRAAAARDRAATASRMQARAALRNMRQLVALDVRLAVNEAERARQQISASRTTRELQEKTYEAEKQRFDVGASTSLLVGQAQRDLLAAQIAEVESIVRYRIALVLLYLSEGSLLERRGVTLGR